MVYILNFKDPASFQIHSSRFEPGTIRLSYQCATMLSCLLNIFWLVGNEFVTKLNRTGPQTSAYPGRDSRWVSYRIYLSQGKAWSWICYWLSYWHILISKGTRGFTSNTLMIRIQYCYQFKYFTVKSSLKITQF